MNTDDYLSLVLSFPHVPPLSVLTIFFLGLMRLAPVVAIAPFLGARLPSPVKIGLLIALTLVLLPFLITHTAKQTVPTFDSGFYLFALKEVFIGFILAFLITIPFYIVQSCGVLIDFLRGSSALMAQDALMQTQASPIGLLYNYVFIVLFYQIDGLFIFLDAIFKSYQIIPVDAFISPLFFQQNHFFWRTIFTLLTQFTAISIQLAAPCIVAILMAETFLGIANRLAQQVQISFLGMALKSLLGILLLWAGWFFILQQVVVQANLWSGQLYKLVLSLPRA